MERKGLFVVHNKRRDKPMEMISVVETNRTKYKKLSLGLRNNDAINSFSISKIIRKRAKGGKERTPEEMVNFLIGMNIIKEAGFRLHDKVDLLINMETKEGYFVRNDSGYSITKSSKNVAQVQVHWLVKFPEVDADKGRQYILHECISHQEYGRCIYFIFP